MNRGATFSECRRYRYALVRYWGNEPPAGFIGLNPSTADEMQDDPTIRRCIGFAKSWGCGGLVMLNLFAYRATDPRELLRCDDPIGPDNIDMIREWTLGTMSRIWIAAWGAHGHFAGMDDRVCEIVPRLHHLGLTKDGHPRHPLYLRADVKPQPFNFYIPGYSVDSLQLANRPIQ